MEGELSPTLISFLISSASNTNFSGLEFDLRKSIAGPSVSPLQRGTAGKRLLARLRPVVTQGFRKLDRQHTHTHTYKHTPSILVDTESNRQAGHILT